MKFQSIAVFCGSSFGNQATYRLAAQELGKTLADARVRLVYGGGNVGLMGALADSALRAGGEVVGVIPQDLLAKEVGHTGLTKLHVVESMHQRKALMAELSDAFIALPGGWGTFEEFFEIATWAQLELHRKPFGVLNVGGFYDSLLKFLDETTTEGFVRPLHRSMIQSSDSIGNLLFGLEAYQPPTQIKWVADLART
jgi:uncharacterized protein (TIGR00730 family)